MIRLFVLALATWALAGMAVPASAQDRSVPYWASLRHDETNMRVGPSEEYRIDWIYKRKGLPVKVVRLKEGWRLIEDPDGTRGWILGRLLTRERTAMVRGDDPVPIRAEPDSSSALLWRAEQGVIGLLGSCAQSWCELDVAGRKGWVRQENLWGAGEP